jgi:hypothetical protein
MFDLSAVKGYEEVSWISWETPGTVIISFHTIDPVRGTVTNLYMYMLDGSISDVNLVCDPYFPLFRSVEQQFTPDGPRGFQNKLTFLFESGSFSLFCRDVFFREIATPAQVPSSGRK